MGYGIERVLGVPDAVGARDLTNQGVHCGATTKVMGFWSMVGDLRGRGLLDRMLGGVGPTPARARDGVE